jgi:hypothetical protein
MQVLSATSFDVLGNCTKYLTLALSIFLLGSQASAAGIVGVLIALTGGAIYSPAGEASACLPPRKALCLPARCTSAAPSVSQLARTRARLPQAKACVPHPTEWLQWRVSLSSAPSRDSVASTTRGSAGLRGRGAGRARETAVRRNALAGGSGLE